MARSILSMGMLAARHLSRTMRSLGFMFGSPPPIFAAMEISLLNLAKILPRLASSAPLKCLTFAHLLCPAIKSSSSQAGCIACSTANVNEPRRRPICCTGQGVASRPAMPVFGEAQLESEPELLVLVWAEQRRRLWPWLRLLLFLQRGAYRFQKLRSVGSFESS